MLKNVGFRLFLLNSAGLLSVKSFGCWVSRVGVGVLGACKHGLKFSFFVSLGLFLLLCRLGFLSCAFWLKGICT